MNSFCGAGLTSRLISGCTSRIELATTKGAGELAPDCASSAPIIKAT
jgi:hypothetical protein